jgi:signal transduction histidine kinase
MPFSSLNGIFFVRAVPLHLAPPGAVPSHAVPSAPVSMLTSRLFPDEDSMPTPSSPSAIHPLEIIAPFRRWPRSTARDLVYTVLWSTLVGLAVTLVACALMGTTGPLPYWLGTTLLTSNIIGFLIHGMLVALRLAAPAAFARGAWPMRLSQGVLIAACVVLGLKLTDALLRGPGVFLQHPGALMPLLPLGVLVALLTIAVLATVARRRAREAEAARQQQQAADAARLVAEARLRALQAQIEPHFLYNTLANVVGLIGPAPDRARAMLEHLIDFLRASLVASRAGQATLGAECDLAGAYLDVLAVRFGTRLRYRIEVDPDCRALPIAPMLLQPLVENAVMHGIEPQVEGGTIVLRAHAAGAVLTIDVSDDGAGLGNAPPRPGGGVGLANLRERLHSLYGPGAGVQLIENQAGGVSARLLLPLANTVPPSTPSAP